MKKPIRITPVLQIFRKLPLEVSFQQVEQWVKAAPPFEYQPIPWWSLLLNRFGKDQHLN